MTQITRIPAFEYIDCLPCWFTCGFCNSSYVGKSDRKLTFFRNQSCFFFVEISLSTWTFVKKFYAFDFIRSESLSGRQIRIEFIKHSWPRITLLNNLSWPVWKTLKTLKSTAYNPKFMTVNFYYDFIWKSQHRPRLYIYKWMISNNHDFRKNRSFWKLHPSEGFKNHWSRRWFPASLEELTGALINSQAQ